MTLRSTLFWLNLMLVIGLVAPAGVADVDKLTRYGTTPLYDAVLEQNLAMIRLLLEAGADPDIPAKYEGRTPLFEAVLEPANPTIVKLLLEHGANPNIPDEDGDTPLSLVAGYQTLGVTYTRDHSHPELHALMLAYLDPTSDKYGRPCYTVQKSDVRLSIIAKKALGDPARWPEIAEMNKISKNNPYRLGDCLKLPAE